MSVQPVYDNPLWMKKYFISFITNVVNVVPVGFEVFQPILQVIEQTDPLTALRAEHIHLVTSAAHLPRSLTSTGWNESEGQNKNISAMFSPIESSCPSKHPSIVFESSKFLKNSFFRKKVSFTKNFVDYFIFVRTAELLGL